MFTRLSIHITTYSSSYDYRVEAATRKQGMKRRGGPAVHVSMKSPAYRVRFPYFLSNVIHLFSLSLFPYNIESWWSNCTSRRTIGIDVKTLSLQLWNDLRCSNQYVHFQWGQSPSLTTIIHLLSPSLSLTLTVFIAYSILWRIWFCNLSKEGFSWTDSISSICLW